MTMRDGQRRMESRASHVLRRQRPPHQGTRAVAQMIDLTIDEEDSRESDLAAESARPGDPAAAVLMVRKTFYSVGLPP